MTPEERAEIWTSLAYSEDVPRELSQKLMQELDRLEDVERNLTRESLHYRLALIDIGRLNTSLHSLRDAQGIAEKALKPTGL